MNEVIQEAINVLEDEISENNERIKLLKAFDAISERGLTEEEYHVLCETDLRNSDILGQALSISMPFLIYDRCEPNSFIYMVDDFEVHIPSSSNTWVNIIVEGFHANRDEIETNANLKFCSREMVCERELNKVYTYINSKSLVEKSHICFPTFSKPFAIANYIFRQAGCTDSAHKYLTELLREKMNIEKEKKEYIEEADSKRLELRSILFNYIKRLLKWTNDVYVTDRNHRYTQVHYVMKDNQIVTSE